MKSIETAQASPPQQQERLDAQTIRYRLLSVRGEQGTRYEISIRLKDECSAAVLPFLNRSDAISAYRKIKNGSVTPTTLHDVIEDMK